VLPVLSVILQIYLAQWCDTAEREEGGEEQRGATANIKPDVTLHLHSAHIYPLIGIHSFFFIHTISLCLSHRCTSLSEVNIFREPRVAAVNNVKLLAYY